MRFGLVHRIMTDTLAALGVFALVASGQFSRATNIIVTLAMAMAIALREPARQLAGKKRADAGATIVLLAVQVGRAVFTEAIVLDLVIEFALGLQVIRVATRRGAAHDQQIIVLALLHLIAGTVVGGGLGYGLCFFGLLVVTPGALVLSHLRREVEGNYRQGARDRTGLPVDVPRILRSKRVVGKRFIAVTCLLSVPILLFTVALFVIFPRVGLSLLLLSHPKSGRMIGFSGKVDLGQIGTLRADDTIAARVTVPDLPDPPPAHKVMHLRGTALDHYDGRSWSQSTKLNRILASGGELIAFSQVPNVAQDATMRIQLEPIDPPVVFVPRGATGMRAVDSNSLTVGARATIQRGPEGELRYSSPHDRGLTYIVYMDADKRPSFRSLRASQRSAHLQLPDEFSPRVRALAEEWTAGIQGDTLRARAIQKRLRTEFTYDLSSPSGEAEDPLAHFLFESRAGHCEYYSTAMALMLRSLGIPSRNVTGFIGGTYNKYGEFYAVRQGDAHSWVEAYIKGRGWMTFDPTPSSAAVPLSEMNSVLATVRDIYEAISQRWNQNVLGYDLRQQVSLLESLRSRNKSTQNLLRAPQTRVLLALLGLLLAGGSAFWLYQRRRKRLPSGARAPKHLSKSARLATRLYELLDRAMASIGIARSTSMPPLRHALGLHERNHPLAEELLSLTKIYLSARYGEEAVSADDGRRFERRIRQLKERNKAIVTAADEQLPADAAE